MGTVLTAANQKISDRDEEIERLESELASRPEENSAPIAVNLLDLKVVYEIYKKEKKPGRAFTISELKPFYAAILKTLTPEKGN